MRFIAALALAASVAVADDLDDARRLLQSSNVSEQAEGLKMFEKTGPRTYNDVVAIAALVEDPLLRGAALRAAGAAGEEVVNSMMSSLEDPVIREQTMRGLAAIGGKAAMALAKFGREAEEPQVRAQAFSALSRGGPSAVEALIGVLEDSGPRTRCEASHYLVDAASHATALPAMERALDNRDQEIRLNAMRALRKFAESPGGPGEEERGSVEEARAALRRGAARSDAEVRTWCEAELLDRAIRDDGDVKAATEALVADMTSKDVRVRQAGFAAYAQVSAGLPRFKEAAAAESLSKALVDALGEKETMAAAALGVSTSLGNDPEFAKLLLDGLKSVNPDVRLAMTRLVSMIHPDCRKAARELLAPFLSSDEEDLRLAAEDAIASFDEKDRMK